MNIEALNRPIEPTENPGLETTDPRLGDIVTLVQNGNYLDAADQAQVVFEEDIYDIRLTGFFFFGIFLDQGVNSLLDVFQCLTRLLLENWEAMGPVNKRERHAQISLNWLFKQLDKILQYEEEKKGDTWNKWLESVTNADIQAILDASDELQKALGNTLEDASGPLLEVLFKIKKWLTNLQQLVYEEPETEAEEAETEDTGNTPPGEAVEQQTAPSFAVDMDSLAVQGSYQIKILLKKIGAFEHLIQNKNYAMASLVADDINAIISDFDPKLYFPELFKKFSYLLALNISQFSAFDEKKQTLEWQAMQELYKTDLDSFMAFGGEDIDPDTFKSTGLDEYENRAQDDENGEPIDQDDADEGSEDDDEW